MSAKAIGDAYEVLAGQLLVQAGYRLIATNYRAAGVGEIDIIACNDEQGRQGKTYQTLVCVEVKACRGQTYGQAIDRVTPAKQKRLIKTMQHFLLNNPKYDKADIRFDVIGFAIGQGFVPTWIQSAFLGE